MRTTVLAPALLSLALAGCNTGFEPQYRVKELRVLAVRAHAAGSESAEVRLGDTLALEALFWNPPDRGGPGAVTVTWYGCAPIASELLTPCEDSAVLADPARLASAAAVPTGAVKLLGTCRPAGVPDDACGIEVPLPDAQAALDFWLDIAQASPETYGCRAYAEMHLVAVVEAGGRTAIAQKRLRIVPTDAELWERGLREPGVSYVNLNPIPLTVVRAPTTTGSCGGGTAVSGAGAVPFPSGRTVLCATPMSAPDQFGACGAEAAGREGYEWQWYATEGEFPDEGGVGNATGSEIDFVRPPGAFRLWAILRDDRGGVGWLTLDVGAAPP